VAISSHLIEKLKLDKTKIKQIVFHQIYYYLLKAQQGRRVLKRLLGYELSPVLWRKIKC
jgi:DNA topoisomerase IA